eukprot:SAG31_NODE_2861_length_4987_cov_105.905278_6_plen_119_part_00
MQPISVQAREMLLDTATPNTELAGSCARYCTAPASSSWRTDSSMIFDALVCTACGEVESIAGSIVTSWCHCNVIFAREPLVLVTIAVAVADPDKLAVITSPPAAMTSDGYSTDQDFDS